MSKCLEIMDTAFGVIGSIAAMMACALPMWKVTTNNDTIIWNGLWTKCVTQNTGRTECETYDSILALPQDLQATRAMMVFSSILGDLFSVIETMCTICMKKGAAKAKVRIISGIFFILTGILVFIAVCWSTHIIIHIWGSEIGASLYIGWTSAALFLTGGVMLCICCPTKEENNPPRVAYAAPHIAG